METYLQKPINWNWNDTEYAIKCVLKKFYMNEKKQIRKFEKKNRGAGARFVICSRKRPKI